MAPKKAAPAPAPKKAPVATTPASAKVSAENSVAGKTPASDAPLPAPPAETTATTEAALEPTTTTTKPTESEPSGVSSQPAGEVVAVTAPAPAASPVEAKTEVIPAVPVVEEKEKETAQPKASDEVAQKPVPEEAAATAPSVEKLKKNMSMKKASPPASPTEEPVPAAEASGVSSSVAPTATPAEKPSESPKGTTEAVVDPAASAKPTKTKKETKKSKLSPTLGPVAPAEEEEKTAAAVGRKATPPVPPTPEPTKPEPTAITVAPVKVVMATGPVAADPPTEATPEPVKTKGSKTSSSNALKDDKPKKGSSRSSSSSALQPPPADRTASAKSKSPKARQASPEKAATTTAPANQAMGSRPAAVGTPDTEAQNAASTKLMASLLVAANASDQPLTTMASQSAVRSLSPMQLRSPDSLNGTKLGSTGAGGNNNNTHSPSGRKLSPTTIPISPEAKEASKRIKDQIKRTEEMKKERRRIEMEKLQQDLAKAEEEHKLVLQRQEEERKEKERQLNLRLDQLRQRREERELEYLIGEGRAQKILKSKNLCDLIQEQYDARLAAEQRERDLEWQRQREAFHAPLGPEQFQEVNKRLKEVERRRLRREAELREEAKLLEQQQLKVRQGAVYEHAVNDYIKSKHIENDRKHEKLYRFAKMQEYARIVKAMRDAASGGGQNDDAEYGDDDGDDSAGYRREGDGRKSAQPRSGVPPGGAALGMRQQAMTPPPFDPSPHPHMKAISQPTVPKPSMTVAERNKHGNLNFKVALQAAAASPPSERGHQNGLPPGLKLSPLNSPTSAAGHGTKVPAAGGTGCPPMEDEQQRIKFRKQKGDEYLRELKKLNLVPPAPPVEEEDFIGDVRKLKSKVHRLEVECAQATQQQRSLPRRRSGNEPQDDDHLQVEAELELNAKILNLVQSKVALLQKVESRA